MGASPQTYSKVFETNEKNYEVTLRIEICGSWGFNGKASVSEEFCSYLSKKGIKVNATFIPLPNSTGEYHIFQVLSERNQAIFSNKKKTYPEAFSSSNLNNKDFAEISKKITLWNHCY